METNTIIVQVRIDYTHKGTEQHEQTAAEMAVKRLEEIHNISDGVQITNVEAYLAGEQLF